MEPFIIISDYVHVTKIQNEPVSAARVTLEVG